MKKNFAILSLASAMLLVACDLEEAVASAKNDEGKKLGHISFTLTDASTGEKIDSVQVNSNLYYADSTGTFDFRSHKAGEYSLTVVKEGYAKTRFSLELVDTSSTSVAYVPDFFKAFKLSKTDVNVAGKVFYQLPGEDSLRTANNIVVHLTYANKDSVNGILVLPRSTSVRTNSSGEYLFENIAENTEFYVDVPDATIRNKAYTSSGAVESKGVDSATTLQMKDLLFVLKDENDSAKTNTDTSKTETKDTASVLQQVTDVKVGLTNLDLLLKDTTFATLSKVELQISWKYKGAEAEGYNIYYKTDKMDDYSKFVSTKESPYTRSVVTLASYVDTSITSLSFMVCPFNKDGEVDKSKAKTVTLSLPAAIKAKLAEGNVDPKELEKLVKVE